MLEEVCEILYHYDIGAVTRHRAPGMEARCVTRHGGVADGRLIK